jgi:hypothetical protein
MVPTEPLLPFFQLLALHNTRELVHSPFFSFAAKIFVEDTVGQHLNEDFFEGGSAFYLVIVVQLTKGFIKELANCGGIYVVVITADIPPVGKEIIVFEAGDGELPNGDAELFRHSVYGFIHIVHTHVFATKAEELLGATNYYYLAFLSI